MVIGILPVVSTGVVDTVSVVDGIVVDGVDMLDESVLVLVEEGVDMSVPVDFSGE